MKNLHLLIALCLPGKENHTHTHKIHNKVCVGPNLKTTTSEKEKRRDRIGSRVQKNSRFGVWRRRKKKENPQHSRDPERLAYAFEPNCIEWRRRRKRRQSSTPPPGFYFHPIQTWLCCLKRQESRKSGRIYAEGHSL